MYVGGGCEEGAGSKKAMYRTAGRKKQEQVNPDSFTFRGSFDGYFLAVKPNRRRDSNEHLTGKQTKKEIKSDG